MTGEDASDERRAEVREVLGLNDPVYIQFARFLGNIVQGNFGISYQLRRPVSELIAERLPATIELVVISALIALITGTLLGVYTGINRKSFVVPRLYSYKSNKSRDLSIRYLVSQLHSIQLNIFFLLIF
mgnify:CR=1 FL=1